MNANFGYANAISTALAASAAFAQTGDTAPSTTNQPIHAWPQTAPACPIARLLPESAGKPAAGSP